MVLIWLLNFPFFYSSQSAEIFAKGAVGILEELKCESMVFGSESGKINEVKKNIYTSRE